MSSATQLRVATAAILIPAVVALIWWGPTLLVAAAASIVVIFALREFFTLGEQIGFRAYRSWTYLCALLIFVQHWCATRSPNIAHLDDDLYSRRIPQFSLEMVLVLFIIGAAIIALRSRRPLSEIFSSVSVSAAGLVVIAIPFSAIVRLHGAGAASNLARPQLGPQLLLFTLVIVWVGDSAAYFVGRNFGRKKMAPHLSPNKTWEGAAANFVGALLVAVLFAYWMKIEIPHMLAIAALGSIAGQIGDLFESAFKRSAGVKDSGTLLPGHGGMLDRIDALILAAPAVWYYFQWFIISKV